MQLSQPVLTLDEKALNVHDEGRRIRAAGSLIPMRIPGGPETWGTAHRHVADIILRHPKLSRNPQHWAALQAGEVPPDWGPLAFLVAPTMNTAEGEDHRRLRKPVQDAFSKSRVEALKPHIEQRVAMLLEEIPVNQLVDLRRDFAYKLPMSIICELLGLTDEKKRDRLAREYDAIQETSSTRAAEAHSAVMGIVADLVAQKRREPGGDLTTALIRAQTEDQESLTDAELSSTLMTLFFAGHETTQNLITNGVRALVDPAHRDQLELLLTDEVPWESATEETLRYDGSVNILMFRYATDATVIAGVTVPKGQAIMVALAGVGRDPDVFGPTTDSFDVRREGASGHRAFGHGLHYCLGAPLARQITTIALRELFSRFEVHCPTLGSLTPLPSYISNSVQELPIIATVRAPV
ncbi:cytochrome P450 [Streptomyces sp. NPDC047082]|uniref:cytochrome P450 n=1 Tax=Streptomyces sp. NPDC047082 TaxID=3155259 RepID=UPI0033CD6A60